MTTPAESAKAFHEAVLSAIDRCGRFETTENPLSGPVFQAWFNQLQDARAMLYVANDIARRLRAMVEAEG